MKNYKKYLMLISLLIIPNIILASTNNTISLYEAVFYELFTTIFAILFVLKPLSKLFSETESEKLFWKLFGIRALILIIFDLFISTNIYKTDILVIAIFGIFIVPICSMIKKKDPYKNVQAMPNITVTSQMANKTKSRVIIKCAKCGNVMNVNDKFCINCGEAFSGNNAVVSEEVIEVVNPSKFDIIFQAKDDDKLLEAFIYRELKKAELNLDTTLIPQELMKRKNIFNIIFSVLIFVYVSLIFFHFPLITYIIGIVILFILSKLTKKYNLMNYLKKEVKSRPGEKISNIIMNTKVSLIEDTSKKKNIVFILIAVIIPLVIFYEPRIMYEKTTGGYAVRFYTFGLTNYKTATIPETYKNEKIVELRGNTFSNMPFLERVNLPNSIKEIRGQAFKNDRKLSVVNIPSNLEYLGGGAFYNCTSITEITLPDTLTELGGEAFYNASSLKYIKLSEKLTEIKGNTFEECTSLTSIVIPDKVTRIGGHAFYHNTSLSSVTISRNSKLTEIGSSAFRQCPSLQSIIYPCRAYVNERAFKESPTSVQCYR